ncbi:MAG: oxidoreductase [Cyanobacteriota bacterium]|jgi:protochlorophyllide reductase|nr:oxidoreductase [Cyanobacteriota bacterium]
MPWTVCDIPDQSSRLVLVTGASSGLGLETARALLARGATVILGCRDQERAKLACQQLQATAANGGGTIDLLSLDLASLSSVRRAAAELADRYGLLDLLINNAGVMGLPRTLTDDGFEMQLGVNHLGHFALTQALLPLMVNRPNSRVVNVTSGAQYFGRIGFDDLQGERRYDRWVAYSQSKLANVMMALELQERLHQQGHHTQALAAHPGIARTNLQPSSVAASGSRVEPLAYKLMAPLFQSAAMGALPQLFAATSPEASPGGHYGPDRLGGMRGWPTSVRVAPRALNRDDRRRLWELSETLTAA